MEIAFYITAFIAAISTLRVITHNNAARALLYLVVSLLAVAVSFYTLGAPFAAALEAIVYAGAIMVLFVFAVMMLNLNIDTIDKEQAWVDSVSWVGPAILATILFVIMIVAVWSGDVTHTVSAEPLAARAVGTIMFGPYLLIVELASFMLLAALVVAGHVGREDVRPGKAAPDTTAPDQADH